MTIIGCMIPETWSVMDTEFFVILDHFLPFYSPNNPKDKSFVRLKKMPRDIIIWHKCTKNHDHMLYRSLDVAHNKFNYFSFWANFCHFTSLTAQKIKIKKKMKKKPGDIIILHTSVPKIIIICYTVAEIWHVTNVLIFYFGIFFCPFNHLPVQKIKI